MGGGDHIRFEKIMIPSHFFNYIGGSIGVVVVLVIVIEILRWIPPGIIPPVWLVRR